MDKKKIELDAKPFVLISRQNDEMLKPDIPKITNEHLHNNVISGPHTIHNYPERDHWDIMNKTGEKIDIKYEPTAEFIKQIKKTIPMELQVGVKIALRKDGKLLLVKRSADKYPEVGARWDIVGGRIAAGTPLLENLQREVKEETSLEIKGAKLVAAQDILRVPGRHVVRLTYIGSADGEVQLDGDHTEFGWFTLDEALTLENLDIYFRELIENGIIV